MDEYLSKGLNKQGYVQRQEPLKFRDPHYLNHFSTLRQGLLYSRIEFKTCVSGVNNNMMNLFPIWKIISLTQLRATIAKSPIVPQILHTGIKKDIGRAGQKVKGT